MKLWPGKAVITPRELAEMARCSQDLIYDMLKAGELQGKKVGGRWKIPRPVALRFVGWSDDPDAEEPKLLPPGRPKRKPLPDPKDEKIVRDFLGY